MKQSDKKEGTTKEGRKKNIDKPKKTADTKRQ